MTPATRFRLLALIALPLGLVACEAGSIGILGTESERTHVHLDGPTSSLGAYRYYDGVRLLECDLRLTARAEGGRSRDEIRWLEASADIIDRRSGLYLGGEYLGPVELSSLWGSTILEAGDRRTSRSIRYTSYAPFRVEFAFRYRVEPGGRSDIAYHTFDCR